MCFAFPGGGVEVRLGFGPGRRGSLGHISSPTARPDDFNPTLIRGLKSVQATLNSTVTPFPARISQQNRYSAMPLADLTP